MTMMVAGIDIAHGRLGKRQSSKARILISAVTCCSLLATASGFHAAGTPNAAISLRQSALNRNCDGLTRLGKVFFPCQGNEVAFRRGIAQSGVSAIVADAEDMDEREMRVKGAGRKMMPAWNARQPSFPVSYTPVATIVAAPVFDKELQEMEVEEQWQKPNAFDQRRIGTPPQKPIIVPQSQSGGLVAPVRATPPPVRMELPASVDMHGESRVARPATRYDADEQAVKLLHAKATRAALQATRMRKLAQEKENGGLLPLHTENMRETNCEPGSSFLSNVACWCVQNCILYVLV